MAGTAMTGVGPYGYMGAMNDMSLLPILQQYRSGVTTLDNASLNGYSPSFTSMPTVQAPAFNSQNYWDQMQQNQDRMMQNTIRQRQSWNRMDAEVNGPMYQINKAGETLHDKILQNEQDQIQSALAAYKQAIKEAYYQNEDIDDDRLTAIAQTQYERQFGTRLLDDIRNNATSSFGNGFVRYATFGLFGDKVSAEDNIAQITKQPPSSKAKTWQKTGRVAGGTLAGAAVGAAVGSFIPIIGTGVGAVVGGAIGLIKGLFS